LNLSVVSRANELEYLLILVLSFQAVVYINVRVIKEDLDHPVLEQEIHGHDDVEKPYATMEEDRGSTMEEDRGDSTFV
jgi:hypothetical protein